MAAVAPAAQADSTVVFPAGPRVPQHHGGDRRSRRGVDNRPPDRHPADPADLDAPRCSWAATPDPYSAIGVDGVRDARYADGADGELSTADCSVYDGSEL